MRFLVRVPVLGAVVLTLVSVSACSYTPDSVENRTRLPSCGEYETRNEPLSPDQLRKNRCILDALDQGRQAELIRTWYGEEGGPITEYVCQGLDETPYGTVEGAGCREIPLEDAVS